MEPNPILEATKRILRDAATRATEELTHDPNLQVKVEGRKTGSQHLPTKRTSPTSPDRAMRSLTPEDISDFEKAATSRIAGTTSKKTVKQFLKYMWSVDYWRMRRLVKDMNWLRKRAVREGIAEGDIPWRDLR